jgi:hypothetical protein
VGDEVDEELVDAEQVVQPGAGGDGVQAAPDLPRGGRGLAAGGGVEREAERAEGPAPGLGAAASLPVAEAVQERGAVQDGQPPLGAAQGREQQGVDLGGVWPDRRR